MNARSMTAALTIAVAMLMTGTAQADVSEGVEVGNPGNYEVQSEPEFVIVNHSGGIEVPWPFGPCTVHWEISVNADGSGYIDGEGFAGGICDTWEPCDQHAAWPMQIEEDEASGAFRIHFEFCAENTQTTLSGVVVPVECEISETTTTSFACDQQILASTAEIWTDLDVDGLLAIGHAPER
jgi:hypothetical protein